MKKVLLVLILFTSCFCGAQNYQCLQSGVQHYFINNNNYLRGIRIDSVKTFADSTIYYPFHTPRAGWEPYVGVPVPINFDSTKGSWLGKKVVQLNDGTFLFDNLWGDTVIIQTQATMGSSWLFCRDTSGHYYMATVTAIDTMTFLGILDSVKTLTINAYYHSALLTSDSLNGFQIVLSKNNGFVQVFDLYTFPYHPTDTVYYTGIDYYLDVSLMSSPTAFTPAPGVNNSIYKLTTFINPTSNQLYAANIGDVFERSHNYCAFCAYGLSIFPLTYTIDTIITKTISPHSITYTSSGLTGNYNSMTSSYPATYYSGGYTTDDSTFLFNGAMPEEANANVYSYYFPDDTSYCTQSPSYKSGYTYTIDWHTYIYKIGFGQTYYYWRTTDPMYWQDELVFTNKNNIPCGSYRLLSLGIPVINSKDNSLSIYPNPASTTLTITSTEKITDVVVTNIIGQTIFTHEYNAPQVQVDVSTLPSGIYFVKVNNTAMRKFVKG